MIRFLTWFLPCGVFKRDADGTPLILISWNGTTSMTDAGIRRALQSQADAGVKR
jgi:hypothetical protein